MYYYCAWHLGITWPYLFSIGSFEISKFETFNFILFQHCCYSRLPLAISMKFHGQFFYFCQKDWCFRRNHFLIWHNKSIISLPFGRSFQNFIAKFIISVHPSYTGSSIFFYNWLCWSWLECVCIEARATSNVIIKNALQPGVTDSTCLFGRRGRCSGIDGLVYIVSSVQSESGSMTLSPKQKRKRKKIGR